MSQKIKPLGGRILVKRSQSKEITKGGIIIPEAAKEQSQEGEVVAIGTGRITDDGKVLPFNVAVGNRVLLSKYAGSEVEIDGAKHVLVTEDDILGVLN